jgi:hypothetical protein
MKKPESNGRCRIVLTGGPGGGRHSVGHAPPTCGQENCDCNDGDEATSSARFSAPQLLCPWRAATPYSFKRY